MIEVRLGSKNAERVLLYIFTRLEKALSFYPAKEQEELTMNRRRPRAKGKTL